MADPIPADNSAPTPAPVTDPAATGASASQPQAAAPAPQESASATHTAAAAAPRKSSFLLVALIALGITGLGSFMLLASAMRAPATNAGTPAVETANVAPAAEMPQAPPAAAAETAAVVESNVEPPEGAAPKWVASRNPRKAGLGANIVFELAADDDVEVWRKRVRPVLTVRCAARATEVFVVTESPASIEDNSNKHTVGLAFDGREPLEQKWEHSIDHDALFAPDGRATIRRIAGARDLSFTFAPFNAPPATVNFRVAGLTAQHKTAARMCGLETAAQARKAAPPARRR